MKKQTLLVPLLVFMFAVAILSGIQTAKAVTESVYSDLIFSVASIHEMTVTLRDGTSNTSAPDAGNQTSDITFTMSTGTDAWLNGSTGGQDQDETNPIIQMDNTGTIDFLLNISINDTMPTCMALRYNTTYDLAYPDPEDYATDVGTTNITLNTTYKPGEPVINLWLWANASGCLQADTSIRRFTMWSIV